MNLYQSLLKKSYKAKSGKLTLKKLSEIYNSISESECAPTHYLDRDGLHKI